MLTFRPARSHDLQLIAAAQEDTFERTFGRPLDSTERATRGARLAAAVDAGALSIAELDGSVAGYWWLETSGGAIRLVDFFVAQSFRGRGIGGKLLGEVKCIAAESGWNAIQLVIGDRNTASQRFFHRHGASCTDNQPSIEGLRNYELRLERPQ